MCPSAFSEDQAHAEPGGERNADGEEAVDGGVVLRHVREHLDHAHLLDLHVRFRLFDDVAAVAQLFGDSLAQRGLVFHQKEMFNRISHLRERQYIDTARGKRKGLRAKGKRKGLRAKG